MQPVLISVVVPTCHRNELLARCLDRLAPGTQTLPAGEYEVIVSDDGSKSTAEELIRTQYPWAKWVPGPRRGPAANRNSGARQAKAPWIAFTDDDCVPDLGWLQSFVAALRPEVQVYEGKTTSVEPYCPLIAEAPVNLTGGNLWSCNMMIAASLFHRIGGFDETFPYANQEDSDLRERLRYQGHSLLFVEEAIIDHPARPRKLGVAFAREQECSILLWYKAGHRGLVWPRLIKQVLSLRLRPILSYRPLGAPSVIALKALFVELWYVAWHSPAWIRKYYALYRDTPPAYTFRQF